MKQTDKLSVFISLVLRHQPEAAGIRLDEHGWADTKELIAGINSTGRKIDMDKLEEIVTSDSKQRYNFNGDKTLIRANQGHSIPVVLKVCSGRMYRDGIVFYLSENGVWLTKYVDPCYITYDKNPE